MSDKIIIPTADAVVTPVLEKIYEKRPSAFKHLNLRSGVYWHPVLGYRAQAAKMLQRLAALAAERRLRSASGQALLEYVASEYEAVPETGKTFAYGHITLGRAPLPTAIPPGTIKKGTRFTRTGFTALGVEYATAEYETLASAFMPYNSTDTVTIPVKATREGAHANTPILTADSTVGVTFPALFPNILVLELQAAGGSDGADDDYVRTYAKAQAIGQYGPTASASRLGALAATGVRHLLVYDDAVAAVQRILVADSSWGSSDRLASLAQQSMYDSDVVGFGCKVSVGKLRNKVISVTATVALRDSSYLAETTDVDVAIHNAVRSYFDDRVDFNVWNTDALKSVIARAHPKVFSCSSVSVHDVSDGSTIAEILSPNYATEQFHYYAANNAMQLTYVGPS